MSMFQSEFPIHWINSALITGVFFLVYLVLTSVIKKQEQLSLDKKRNFFVQTRNLLIIFWIIALVVVWNQELKNFALSVAALAAAIVLLFRDVLVSAIGYMMIMTYRPFTIGSIIEINGYKGEVIDKNLFSVQLYEIGTSGEKTGKMIILPGSLFLTNTVKNESKMRKEFAMCTVKIPVPRQDDILVHKNMLNESLYDVCQNYLAQAKDVFKEMQDDNFIDMPSGEPRVWIVPHDEKIVYIVGRFPAYVNKQFSTQQLILSEYYEKIQKVNKKDPL